MALSCQVVFHIPPLTIQSISRANLVANDSTISAISSILGMRLVFMMIFTLPL